MARFYDMYVIGLALDKTVDTYCALETACIFEQCFTASTEGLILIKMGTYVG